MTARYDYRLIFHPRHDPSNFGQEYRAKQLASFLDNLKRAGQDGWHVVGDVELVGEKAVILELAIPELPVEPPIPDCFIQALNDSSSGA